LNISSGDEGED